MHMRMNGNAGRHGDDRPEYNPFEYNPFMPDGMGAARKPSSSAVGADHADDAQDDASEDDARTDDGIVSVITGKDEEDDGPGYGDAGIVSMAGDDDPDDGWYAESLRRDRRRRMIVVIISVIAVLALLAAMIWALGTNPLHIGGPDGDNHPPQDGMSQEFRGSGCRIDGQSCSSDDNGNHPAG